MEFLPEEVTALPIAQVVLAGPKDLCTVLHQRLSRCIGFTQNVESSGLRKTSSENTSGLLPSYKLACAETRQWIQQWEAALRVGSVSVWASDREECATLPEPFACGRDPHKKTDFVQHDGLPQCDLHRHLSFEWFRTMSMEIPATVLLVLDFRAFPFIPSSIASAAQNHVVQALKAEAQQVCETFCSVFKKYFWTRALASACVPVIPRMIVAVVLNPASHDHMLSEMSHTVSETMRDVLSRVACIDTVSPLGRFEPSVAKNQVKLKGSQLAVGEVSEKNGFTGISMADIPLTVVPLTLLDDKSVETLSGMIEQNCRYFFESSVSILRKQQADGVELQHTVAPTMQRYRIYYDMELLLRISYLLEYAHDIHNARRTYMSVWETLLSSTVLTCCVCPMETVAIMMFVSIRLLLWYCRLGDARTAVRHIHTFQQGMQYIMRYCQPFGYLVPLWTAVHHFFVTQLLDERFVLSHYSKMAFERTGLGPRCSTDALPAAQTTASKAGKDTKRRLVCSDAVVIRHCLASLEHLATMHRLYGKLLASDDLAVRKALATFPCILLSYFEPCPLFDYESIRCKTTVTLSDRQESDLHFVLGRNQHAMLVQYTYRFVEALYKTYQSLNVCAPRFLALLGFHLGTLFFELRDFAPSLRIWTAVMLSTVGGSACVQGGASDSKSESCAFPFSVYRVYVEPAAWHQTTVLGFEPFINATCARILLAAADATKVPSPSKLGDIAGWSLWDVTQVVQGSRTAFGSPVYSSAQRLADLVIRRLASLTSRSASLRLISGVVSERIEQQSGTSLRTDTAAVSLEHRKDVVELCAWSATMAFFGLLDCSSSAVSLSTALHEAHQFEESGDQNIAGMSRAAFELFFRQLTQAWASATLGLKEPRLPCLSVANNDFCYVPKCCAATLAVRSVKLAEDQTSVDVSFQLALLHWFLVPLRVDRITVVTSNNLAYVCPVSSLMAVYEGTAVSQRWAFNAVAQSSDAQSLTVLPHQLVLFDIALSRVLLTTRIAANQKVSIPGFTVTAVHFHCTAVASSAVDVSISPAVLLPHCCYMSRDSLRDRGCQSGASAFSCGRPASYPPFTNCCASSCCFSNLLMSQTDIQAYLAACRSAAVYPFSLSRTLLRFTPRFSKRHGTGESQSLVSRENAPPLVCRLAARNILHSVTAARGLTLYCSDNECHLPFGSSVLMSCEAPETVITQTLEHVSVQLSYVAKLFRTPVEAKCSLSVTTEFQPVASENAIRTSSLRQEKAPAVYTLAYNQTFDKEGTNDGQRIQPEWCTLRRLKERVSFQVPTTQASLVKMEQRLRECEVSFDLNSEVSGSLSAQTLLSSETVFVLVPKLNVDAKAKLGKHRRFASILKDQGYEVYSLQMPFYFYCYHPGQYTIHVSLEHSSGIEGSVSDAFSIVAVKPFETKTEPVYGFDPANEIVLGPCCNAEHSEKHRFKKLSRRLLISLRNATTEIFQMGGLSVVSRSGKVVGSGVPSPSLPDAKLATLTSDCTALESQNGVDAALAPRDQWSYLIEFDECNGSNNKAQRYGVLCESSEARCDERVFDDALTVEVEFSRSDKSRCNSSCERLIPLRNTFRETFAREQLWNLPKTRVELLVSHPPMGKIGEPFTFSVALVNRTSTSQGCSLQLVYSPTPNVSHKKASSNISPSQQNVGFKFDIDCPFFVGGRLQSSLFLPPSATQVLSWILVPYTTGLLPLPTLNVTFLDETLPSLMPFRDAMPQGVCSLEDIVAFEEQQQNSAALHTGSPPFPSSIVSPYSQVTILP